MADINELISKQALDAIAKLEKDLEKLATGLTSVFTEAQKLNAALVGIKPTELDKIAAAQKKSAENAKQLSKEEEKLLEIQKKKAAEQEKAKKQAAEAIKAEKERLSAMAALDKQRQKALEQLAKMEAAEREALDLMVMEAKTIAELRKQNSALTKQRDQLDTTTQEGADAIAELNKRIDENNKVIKANLDAAGQQRTNIGNYKEDVKAALAETGLFSQEIRTLTQIKKILLLLLKGSSAAQAAETVATEGQTEATRALTVAQRAQNAATLVGANAMKVLRVALLATGIGAIVVAIASLVSYFRATEEGANRLRKILAPFGVIMGNIADIATRLGGSLLDLFSGDRESAQKQFNEALDKTRNLYSETNAEIRAQQKLLDDQLKLTQFNRAALVETARLESEIQQKRLEAEELKTKDDAASIAALEAAISMERKLLAIQQHAADEAVRIAKAEAELNDTNAEGLDNIAQLEAERIRLVGRNAQREKELVAQIREARTRVANERKVQIAEEVKEQEEANKKLLELTTSLYKETAELDFRNKLGREATEMEILERKTQLLTEEVEMSKASETEKQKALTAIAENAEAQRTAIRAKELNERRALAIEEAQFLEELELELIEVIDKELEDEVKKFEANEEKKRKAAEETAKARIEGEQMVKQAAIDLGKEAINAIFEINARANDAELARLESLRDKKIITEEQYDAKVKEIRIKQAKRDKAQALLNATIGTAEAVVKALASTVPPFNFILASLVGAAGAVQIGLIASEPLPAFAKGTESAPEGYARVAEKGRELLVSPKGALSLTGNKEEIRYLSAGTKVIPNRETEEIISGARRSAGISNEVIKRLNSIRSVTIQPSKAKITDRQGSYFRNYLNAKTK